MADIGMRRALTMSYDAALETLPEKLKAEGFGVLTRIDLKATFKEKLNADFRRYTILGACNPQLAWKALGLSLGFGTMMPCNVTVYETDEGTAVVTAVDPQQTAAAQGGPEMRAVAEAVREKLARVLESL